MGEDKPKTDTEEGQGKNAAKKAAKKEAKAAKRAEHKSANQTAQPDAAGDQEDVSKGKYGNLPLIKSESSPPERDFINVTDLTKSSSGTVKWIRARLHAVRAKGKQCFAVFRQREATVQGIMCAGDGISKQMIKFASRLGCEVGLFLFFFIGLWF